MWGQVPSFLPVAYSSPPGHAAMKLSFFWMVVGVASLHVVGGLQETTAKAEETNTPATIFLTSSVAPVTISVEPVLDNVSTTAKPIQPTTQAVPTTTSRRFPCKCLEGSCMCCTGYLLNRLNLTTRNRACLKVDYEPDEFEFNFKFLFNERQLYQSKISGKNPQPICLPIRRIVSINACVKFSNVYMIGRNLHACLDLEGDWNDFELFSVSFECFRVGLDGVAVVKPEEGGGLPVPTHKPTNLGPLDYDDSARSHQNLELTYLS